MALRETFPVRIRALAICIRRHREGPSKPAVVFGLAQGDSGERNVQGCPTLLTLTGPEHIVNRLKD